LKQLVLIIEKYFIWIKMSIVEIFPLIGGYGGLK